MSEPIRTDEPRTQTDPRNVPGVCIPWDEKRKELPSVLGDEAIVRRIWEQNEGLAYTYIWQCLLSF